MASPEAGQNLRNNMVELNNWRKPMAGNINGMIGPKQAAQANVATTDYMTGQLKAGMASIKPQIIAWPYAADDDGATFDQANLWGVRFNAYNPEQNAVIAVPRTLPGGYTATVDRGGWQCQQAGINVPVDYTSADSGATWSNNGGIFSTPQTRFYMRAPPNLGSVPKDWGPCNWANKSGAGGGNSYNDSYYHTDVPGNIYIKVAAIQGDHAGFRRIRIRWFDNGKGTSAFPMPTLSVGYTAKGVGLPGWPTMPTQVFTQALLWSDLIPNGATNSYQDVMVTTALAPSIGTRVDWYITMQTTNGMTPSQGDSTFLSPRTDIPFPFDVVGLNNGTSSDWHAPGGYV